MLNNEASAADPILLLATNSAANTAAATGAWIDLGTNHEGSMLFFHALGAITGSYSALIQDADDINGTNAATVSNGVFPTAVANTMTKITVPRPSMRRFVRYLGTVTTGPTLVGAGAFCRLKTV